MGICSAHPPHRRSSWDKSGSCNPSRQKAGKKIRDRPQGPSEALSSLWLFYQSLVQFFERPPEEIAKLFVLERCGASPRDYNTVPFGEECSVYAEKLADDPLQAIALRRAADIARGNDSQAPPPARQKTQGQNPLANADAPFLHGQKFIRQAKAAGFGKALRHRLRQALTPTRLRPLRRRAAITLRPLFFAMRVRNPCLFLRFRLLG